MQDQDSPQWQPSPAEKTAADQTPQMSEAATVGNVFFEPGNTFEDLRRKPRFIIAGLIVVLMTSIFSIAFIQKIGYENIVRSRIESSSWTRDMSSELKEQQVAQQAGTVGKYIAYAIVPIALLLVLFVGGLLYWLGSKAMGGDASYLGGVAVWTYSMLPPSVVFVIANLIVLFIKSSDEIDIQASQSGLVQANPGFFIDSTMPVLKAALSTFDLFAIWGWILAAIGLQKVAKLSSGSAWTVVLIIGMIGVAAKILGAAFF